MAGLRPISGGLGARAPGPGYKAGEVGAAKVSALRPPGTGLWFSTNGAQREVRVVVTSDRWSYWRESSGGLRS